MTTRSRIARAPARLVAVVRSDRAGFRAGLAALLISSCTGLVAGVTLGHATDRLAELPGLLVLVPAAIGMRGSIFGALGSRLGTLVHTGAWTSSLRGTSPTGQNALASVLLSLSVSAALAVLAKAVSVGFGIPGTISVLDLFVISMVGGIISSAVVLVLTIAVARVAARRGWDLDNVAAPIVTSSGDVVTLPALVLATVLIDRTVLTPVLGVVLLTLAVASTIGGVWNPRLLVRTIVRQSLPILLLAGTVDTVAGVTVERRLSTFTVFPVLIVLFPPFLGQSGSLGGILASRIGTKLHLGLIGSRTRGFGPIADDVLLVVIYAIPVFFILGVVTDSIGAILGFASPGAFEVIAIALVAGAMTTALVVVVAYTTALASYRLGLDPDNYGIPVVTSALDLGGAFAIAIAISLVGVH